MIRRFSDFRLIRQFLITKWPGCYIPPLPPRKAIVYIKDLRLLGKYGLEVHR